MPTCQTCFFWKKDWGIWAHNRWTREHTDRGFCTANSALIPPLDMRGDSIICYQYLPTVEAPLVFYAPTV